MHIYHAERWTRLRHSVSPHGNVKPSHGASEWCRRRQLTHRLLHAVGALGSDCVRDVASMRGCDRGIRLSPSVSSSRTTLLQESRAFIAGIERFGTEGCLSPQPIGYFHSSSCGTSRHRFQFWHAPAPTLMFFLRGNQQGLIAPLRPLVRDFPLAPLVSSCSLGFSLRRARENPRWASAGA